MTVIYADQWLSRNGLLHENGKYTAAAKEWAETLAGLTARQIKSGFDALRKNGEEWPPNAIKFRKLCLSLELESLPTVNEVYNILAYNKNKQGSIKDRFEHPLVFSIANAVDLQKVRYESLKTAMQLITPVYDRLIKQGWPDWKPEHLLTPALIEKKPTEVNSNIARKSFAEMRKSL